jgi:arginase
VLGLLAGYAHVAPRLGLLYVDAHPDLNTPESVAQGALDWMGMAHALGEADAVHSLSHVGPRFPLVRRDEVAFFAVVDSEVTEWKRRLLERKGGLVYSATVVAGRGHQAASEAVAAVKAHVESFVVHLDVDAIDFVDFPIADNAYQRNQGLTLDDAMTVLATFAGDPVFGGLAITEVNPDHAVAEADLLQRFAAAVTASLGAATSRHHHGG